MGKMINTWNKTIGRIKRFRIGKPTPQSKPKIKPKGDLFTEYYGGKRINAMTKKKKEERKYKGPYDI
jgi:hypothetical protein